MPVSKSEAVSRLSVAIDRCRGDAIPLSTETAEALGKKGSKSISKADARKMIESEDGGLESGASKEDPPKVAKGRKAAKPKADEAPKTEDQTPAEDPLS